MESKVTYLNEENIKHVKYENLYYINNNYEFLTTDNNVELDSVYLMGGALDIKYKDKFTFLPIKKVFNNLDEIEEYLLEYKIETIDGITNCLTHYFDHNISHALFDSLYPIYLTLLLYYNQEERFNILIDYIKIIGWVFPGHASREYSIEIFKNFCKGEIINKADLTGNYRFSSIIAGSGFAGISGVNNVGIMPGKSISALDKFRDRMFEVYNIKPVVNDKINFTIIDSQRYTDRDKSVLLKINDYLNSVPNYRSRIISWFDIKEFREQLEIMNTTDIHISGAGSSMLNFPFLNKGKTHINLGVDQINPIHRFGVKWGCTMPGLLEINICLLPNTIFVDFYDIYRYRNITYEQVLEIILTNVDNLDKEKSTIIPRYVLRWRELCNSNEEKMQILIKRMTYPPSNYPDLIPTRFMDIVVADFPPYGNNNKIMELL